MVYVQLLPSVVHFDQTDSFVLLIYVSAPFPAAFLTDDGVVDQATRRRKLYHSVMVLLANKRHVVLQINN